jgi:hypothetical protein
LDEDNNITGVFDWDLSIELGLPLIDLFLFTGFEESEKRKKSFQSVILEDFITIDGSANEMVRKYIDETDKFLKDKVKYFAFLCIVYYFLYHMGPYWRQLEVNNKEIERVIMAAEEGFNEKQVESTVQPMPNQKMDHSPLCF